MKKYCIIHLFGKKGKVKGLPICINIWIISKIHILSRKKIVILNCITILEIIKKNRYA